MLSAWGRRAVVALVALSLAALPACTGGGGDGYEVTAYFPKAVSLYEQGDVKILGLSAGTITEVQVVDTQVRVRMRIDEGVNLPQDVRATIVPLSLIGERYVQLFPAWTTGEPTAKPDTVIPLERTSIPVEPDEALAALKKFLDTLDPNATGRLVKNLAADLKGNGQALNDALGEFSKLTATLAEKDEQLSSLIENFDKFTATLRTRETQLGKVMDQFAAMTDLLADERETVSRLIKALAQTSSAGLDLVSEHGGALNQDVQTLVETLEIVNTNMEHVREILASGPILVAGQNLDGEQGLVRSYDPTFKHIDLRQATTPTLARLFEQLGVPTEGFCLPVDVECEEEPEFPVGGAQQPRQARPTLRNPGPVDAVVGLLTSRAAPQAAPQAAGPQAAASPPPAASPAAVREPAADDAGATRGGGGPLGALRKAARWFAGVFG